MKSVAMIAMVLGLSAASLAHASPSLPGRVEFEVFRNGEAFGRHMVTVTQSGDTFSAESRVALRVNVGPLTLYRYEHGCREQWRGGALTQVNCETLRDGRRTRVAGENEAGRLRVSGTQGDTFFATDARLTSWWTMPSPRTTFMIDAETGARMPLRVTDMGWDTIEIAGAPVGARRMRVQGAITVDLWYDARGRWIGCAFNASGQRIEYRLATTLSAAPA